MPNCIHVVPDAHDNWQITYGETVVRFLSPLQRDAVLTIIHALAPVEIAVCPPEKGVTSGSASEVRSGSDFRSVRGHMEGGGNRAYPQLDAGYVSPEDSQPTPRDWGQVDLQGNQR